MQDEGFTRSERMRVSIKKSKEVMRCLEKTYSGLAATRALIRPSLPALASRICRRALRASFSSNPACFAVPESSSASTSVSASVLYAAVLRMGSVVEAMVEETAADALDI
jgi:hypothetical protein